LNANKRGVTLDLQSREDYRTLVQLIGVADIFVTDLSPRQSSQLGVDYAHLRHVNPPLIATYVSPFGYTGPYRDYKGSDLVAWHMGGMGHETPFYAVTDLESQPPLGGGGYQAEYLAGWTAAAATMVALFYRETYGLGQMVDVSAMEAVANHIRGNFAVYSYDITKLPQSRLKSSFSWIWPCKDGYVSTSFVLDHWWEALVELMGCPAWADNSAFGDLPGRREHMDEIEAHVSAWLRQRTRHELYEMLKSRGISCFPVLSIQEILEAPQYSARGFFVEQTHPVAGRVKQPGPPVRLWSTPWSLDRPAPTLGQHNQEVSDRVGVDQDQALEPAYGRAAPSFDDPEPRDLDDEGERNRPLKGIRVLDFGWILSVPHCGAWLGTMGAEVIRVESEARLELGRRAILAAADGIRGVNRSAAWNGLNYSKLDVTLNLTEPAAVELVKQLVAISDVVMENFATGVMDRLGLGSEALRKIRPDLIMLSGSTLGVTGPEREASGWGPNVCSYAGQP
ncbi:MAG: CoA transferase, partial [Anaerolineae bacterium]